MPWKGLKFASADNNGPKKGGAAVSLNPPRRSEHVPRPLAQLLPRRSESPSRSLHAAHPNGVESSRTPLPPAPPPLPDASPNHDAETQSKKRGRFNLMRLQHASDPQLSSSYKRAEKTPVPAVPTPPQIITTAPTSASVDEPTKTKPASMVRTTSHPPPSKPQARASCDQVSAQDTSAPGKRSSAEDSLGKPAVQGRGVEEGQTRLSTASARSWGNQPQGNPTPGARISDSSRSDGNSTADPATGRTTPKNSPAASTSSLFRLPHRKKNRNSLFPLPVKVPSPGQSTPDLKESPDSRQQTRSGVQNQDHVSAQPSPSRSSFGQGTAAGDSPVAALFRKDSETSAQSARSSLSLRKTRGAAGKGRSSTVGSLADIQDDDPRRLPPDLASSDRNSTSTGPRKSFTDLFHLTNRVKQSGDGARTGDGSPGTGAPATPGSATSKANSFSLQRELELCPSRETDDTPASYLTKLEGAVNRKVIATVLSQSSEDFYATALRKYIRGFSFFGEPMDMAIRKLLMEAELPKETQQIDRVIQGFANRYHECNPGIFTSTDQAYFIAFSLLILHTDVFNKNNKRKMQKHDYVKNTQGEGIADDILECFYDNICYTPFIHVEDELNLGSRMLHPKSRNILLKMASSDHLPRSARDPVDPYALILDGKVGSLRPSFKGVMELDDVYSTSSSGPCPSIDQLHQSFYKPCVLQIVSARSRPDAFLTQSSIANPLQSHPGLVDIRVAKVGLLWRKDPKKKKTRSPWQEWGAVLTGSQLYFFRDVQWVKSLLSQYETHQKHGQRRQAVTFKPPVTDFKPDATVSVADAVALVDASYKKHKHAFIFVRHGGFEEVFLANSDEDMNDWLATLNYAAAFRTCGVRVRGMIGANYEGQRSETQAPAESTASEESPEQSAAAGAASTANRNMDPHLVEEVFRARRQLVSQRIAEANEKLAVSQKQLDNHLRNARHLQVLTPIQPRARDQVIFAAGKIAAKIKWARMEVWRTKCHRDVLAQDLSEEEKHLGVSATKVDQSTTTTATTTTTTSASDGLSVAIPSAQLDLELDAGRDSTSTAGDARRKSVQASVNLSRKSKSIASVDRVTLRESLERPPSPSEIDSLLRKGSIAESKDDFFVLPSTQRPASLPRQTSTASQQSKEGSLSTVQPPSHQPTPAPDVAEDEEEHFLRESGILPANEPGGGESTAESGKPQGALAESGAGEHRSSKVRRSLQRSLREAHIPHSHHSHHGHQRNKKSRDQTATTAAPDAGQSVSEIQGLSRSSPSFTLHGKKASVVTFGSEWQNVPPEERLKRKKPLNSDDSKTSEVASADEGLDSSLSGSVRGKNESSVRSVSTVTGTSARNLDAAQGQTTVAEVLEEPQETNVSKKDGRGIDSDSAVAMDASPKRDNEKTADAQNVNIAADTPLDRDATDVSNSLDQEGLAKENKTMSHSISSAEKLEHISPDQAVKA